MGRLLSLVTAALISSCAAKFNSPDRGPVGGTSGLSSVDMKVPSALSAYLAPDKINAFSFAIKPGTCRDGSVGTTVAASIAKATPQAQITATSLKQGCAYTIQLSFGQSKDLKKLDLVLLTNQLNQAGTEITAAQTLTSKLSVNVLLNVTAEGQKVLGIDANGQPINVPSQPNQNNGQNIGQNNGQNQPQPPIQTNYNWRNVLKWTPAPTYPFNENDYGSAYYKDIMIHTAPHQRYRKSAEDPNPPVTTIAHESLHGLTNEMVNASKESDDYVYYGNGQGAYVLRPKEILNEVVKYIQPNYRALTESRVQTYLVIHPAYNKNLLHIFDEWNGYIVTSKSAVDLLNVKYNDPNENVDPFEGLADMVYFCSASLLALQDHDPEYLQNNTQFKAIFAMFLEQSGELLRDGPKMATKWNNTHANEKLAAFKNDPENAKIRNALIQFLGADYVKAHLGF
jgi:hypothetical protein